MASSAAGETNSAGNAGRRAALLLVATAAAVIFVGFFPIVAGLLSAPALAVVCRPLHTRLSLRMSRRVAALLTVALVWVCILVPAAWLASVAIQQVPNALSDVHRVADRVREIPTPFGHTNADSLVAQLGAKSGGWISAAVGPAFGAIGRVGVDMSVASLVLYFLLVTGESGWKAVRRWLPFSEKGSDELKSAFTDTTRATLLGRISSAALQAVSMGLGFRLIGNDAPVLWGAVGGLSTLIPVVGNTVVWVPAVVAQIVRRDYMAAFIMFVFGRLIPLLIDQGVLATISRRVGKTHPMVTFLGVLFGIRLMGPIGIVIGPPLLQSSLVLFRLYDREYGVPWAGAAKT